MHSFLDDPAYTAYTSIDLNQFDDSRLSGAGELSIPPRLSYPVLLQLGANTLKLTQQIINKPPSKVDTKATSYYSISQFDPQKDSGTIVLDNRLRFDNLETVGGATYRAHSRQDVTLGYKASEELGLDTSARDEHMIVRLGSLAGNLHFMDIANQPGHPVVVSSVLLHPDDIRGISHPARAYNIQRDETGILTAMNTKEQNNGKWTRREF